MPRANAHAFPENGDYREQLEFRHLRTKNRFVVALLALGAVGTTVYMALSAFPLRDTIGLFIGFSALLLMNVACIAYGKESIRFNELNKYVTALGVFVLTIAMVFVFQSPSMLALLFIAYALAAFYQDRKVMLISNVFLFFAFLALMTNFRDVFGLSVETFENAFGLFFFVILFITLLTISQYIMIKQKGFFYNQIAIAKETEFRNIEFMIEAGEKATGRKVPGRGYFAALSTFTKALGARIGIEDAFAGKLDALRELEAGTPYDKILASHPELDATALVRLSDLLVTGTHKLRKVAIKLARVRAVDVHRREIFSETQFKTFNHPSDTLDIRIVAFALFYAALKRGIPGMRPLRETEIYDALVHSDYFYYNDPGVMRIYRDNSEVFDAIARDAFGPEATR